METPELERAVAADPNDAALRLRLGEALLDAGRPDDALDHLRRAMILEPDRVEAYLALGRALVAEEEHIAAIATLEGGRDRAAALGRDECVPAFDALLAELGPGKRSGGVGALDEEAFSRIARAELAAVAGRLRALAAPIELSHTPSILVLTVAGRAKMGLSEQRSAREIWCTSGLGEVKFRYMTQSSRWRAGGGEELRSVVAGFVAREIGRSVSLD